ncbi:glycosyl hydrolase [Paenibacillus sp. Soil766]|uniref:glycoside hydrolase family 76 protein n=1 Tax=Paenibacillus sp. Soil766 TaxID=1736404 RepID=UPI00070A92C1|nr:glycoside hydrolase family 76 protein [Paenibacillus sp. Soil766]KRF09659.1 glycosyl hydrolase [Paenibacillus sp. Soil766]
MNAEAFVDHVQGALWKLYWNPEKSIMHQWDDSSTVNRPDENYYYWWQAHAVDVCIDGFVRTGKQEYAERMEQLFHGIRQSNGGTFRHHYYDDMEWLALAWLRAYDLTGDRKYREAVADLWEDIQGGWNEQMGGGIAWRKSQLDYKNTPANAPAAILGARLFQRFGDAADLAMAQKIYAWNKATLMDPNDGFVWDGINRQGDGQLDKDWQFTYCQGVFIGAGLELYTCTGEAMYQADARRTAHAVDTRLCDPGSGIMPDEGIDDTGLFKGILTRYLMQMAKCCPDFELPARLITNNAYMLMKQGIDPKGRVGTDWRIAPSEGPIQLSVMLSGVMLLEAYAVLQFNGTYRL